MPLILPGRHHGLRELLDRTAAEHDLQLTPKVEIDAFVQMKALAKLGIGPTILSQAAVAEDLARGDLHALRITQPRVTRRMYLARTRSRPSSNAVAATTNLLREAVAEHDGACWNVIESDTADQ